VQLRYPATIEPQGQHIIANFPDGRVRAVVLEVRSGQLKVQEDRTSRAEWISERDCSPA
jgi:hypothetical protein